ncbi:hypothetical protein MCHI_000516 [Candidatus Magnetoovum chiemensis]|nr:hypothetical protein MCHI_000516 [Candidatus Magnetoovum chiemensis]
MHLLWKALGRQIEDFLNTITLNDLIKGKQIDDYILLADNLNKKAVHV